MKISAIVLAAGSGSRMQSSKKKQFMEIKGKPLVWYSLFAFEKYGVDEIILVTGSEDIDFCKKEIVEKYKKEHDEENNRVYEQVNIYKNTISFVFIGDSRHVQKTLEFFEHIQGRGWWIARNGFKYVIENVGSIMDISTALPAGYIEKNVVDIAVRVQESSIAKFHL